MLRNLLLLVMAACGFTEGRGPHHPPGPVEQHHVHYKPTRLSAEKLTQDDHLLHDTAHLQEHLEDMIREPDLSKMTDEELEFYYFQVHDTDKNAKLDGLEILQAIYHTSHDSSEHEDGEEVVKNDDFEYYVELIDKVLDEDDVDHDGFLSYIEYVTGRKKTAQPIVKSLP